MASELRKTILEAVDLQSEDVTVPEWGNITVRIKGMSGLERARFMNRVAKDNEVNFERWYPEVLIATLYDPTTGDKVFEPADRDAINQRSGAVIQRLGDRAARLSGLMDASVAEAEAEIKSES